MSTDYPQFRPPSQPAPLLGIVDQLHSARRAASGDASPDPKRRRLCGHVGGCRRGQGADALVRAEGGGVEQDARHRPPIREHCGPVIQGLLHRPGRRPIRRHLPVEGSCQRADMVQPRMVRTRRDRAQHQGPGAVLQSAGEGGHTVQTSKDDPQYEVESDKTGRAAIDKPEALHKQRARKGV